MITLKDYINRGVVKDALFWHLENDKPLSESIFRVGSENYFNLFNYARKLMNEGLIELSELDRVLLNETEIGEFAEYEGNNIPLDCPMYEEINEEETEKLNQPKRGGSKKFYVFVRDPQTKNIKKVEWGDTSGLSVKINDPEARKSFAARHQCSTRNDKTTPSYWACRTPRYAKQLGLSGGGNFFW